MQSSRPSGASSIGGRRLRLSLGAAFAATAFVSGTCETQNAVANGDTRSLSIYHTHSKETATITFKRHGSYDRAGLEQLNHILRDWRTHDKIAMDPRLFDVVWEVHREVGSRGAVHIVSAYRAPATNAMLRRRSGGVAKHSQHTLGKAMDFSLPDVGMDKVRAVAMRLQRGGVGYYPSSNAFVHLDVGSVRSWPRMTHDQLARLFPDGKTVHLPTTGKPLAGYELAKAEIVARGGAVSGYSAYADADGAAPSLVTSFFATLFGGADQAEDAEAVKPARGTQLAARPTTEVAARPAPVAASLAALTPGTIPLPVPRPTFDGAEQTQVALVPLPPRRPERAGSAVMLANASLPSRPGGVASLASLETAAPSDAIARPAKPVALAYAPFDAPLPSGSTMPRGSTGSGASTIAQRIANVHADSPAYASDNALKPLFAASVTGSVPSTGARIIMARTHAAAPVADLPRTPEAVIVQLGFVKSTPRPAPQHFGATSTASTFSGFGLF